MVKNSELLSKLDPEVVRRFEERHVRYVRYLPDKSNKKYMNWQHVYNTDDREVSMHIFSRPSPKSQALALLVIFLLVVETWKRYHSSSGDSVAEWYRVLYLKSGGPWFKSSTLLLLGFVLGSSEFNSLTVLSKEPTGQPPTNRDS